MSAAADRKSADPRFLRSLEALLAAVTALADSEPLAGISITRVVETAGVTRPTFYQHFASVAEAAQQAALARLSAAYPPLDPALLDPAPADGPLTEDEIQRRIERHALPVLQHLLAHRPFYLRVLDGAGTAQFFDELVAFLSARLLPGAFEAAVRRSGATTADMLTIQASGIMWLVIRWLRSEAGGEAPEAMAGRLARAVTAMLLPPRTPDAY
ncbi:TetR-like C-terminal domain-containing protein [Marinibaculum pumilum]|uniref:TetR-like C-terminal domain-containing protein n=1 Tax=Marinibaculum pumilum TaxID=1766165 RepID=A0ABV7L555_9PROT